MFPCRRKSVFALLFLLPCVFSFIIPDPFRRLVSLVQTLLDSECLSLYLVSFKVTPLIAPRDSPTSRIRSYLSP